MSKQAKQLENLQATKEDLETEFMMNGSLATSKNDRNTGVPQTLKSQCVSQLKTSNGDNLYDKILTGHKPILFPTACSENCCFEYRFSIKDLILPTALPEVTNLYFRDLVVKIQDMFTQMTADECIKDAIICSYEPYQAVLAQDENGIEIEYHNYNGELTPFITSDRLIKRDSSPLFVVSSNLKYNRRFNLEVASNSYQAIVVTGIYENGELKRRVLKTQTYASPLQLKQCISFYNDNPDEVRDGPYCMDIILCDMLIFCQKSFDLSKNVLSALKPEHLEEAKRKQTVPSDWLSQEEKLKKFGKKGTFMSDFGADEPIPSSHFIFVDATTKCKDIFEVGKPTKTFFDDINHIMCPVRNCYAVSNMLVSVRGAGDK